MVVTARRVEEAAQEVPIPLTVVDSRPGRERRRLQRQSPQGADSDGAVLFDQSAQLGDQHPRSRGAVRPHQRRPRAWCRALRRRRLLRPSGRGDARLPRRRAHRSTARSARDAVRQEHNGGRDQRHHAEAELHERGRLRAELRRSGVRAGKGIGHEPDRRARLRRGCRSRARSATARSSTSRPART